MGFYSRYAKRPLDIFFSLTLLVVLAPIFLIMIALYGLSFSFPVLYQQRRIGKNEKIFTLIKFRSLKNTIGNPADRRFLLGDIVRVTSLDELPQLFNVLSGQMSLIGPRPLPEEYLPLFSATQRQRHDIRPGITGWAQVNGRHSISWQKKFELDIDYAQHLTLARDFRILVMTAVVLLSFKKDVSLAEEKFTGN